MSKIVSLQAENIKRLKAVKIQPNGSMVVIGGENGAGKSSVLDSIMYALAGGKSIPSKPLRKGAKQGKITLDLGETAHGRLIVERTFTEKGSSLTIKSADGYEAPSPQAILDSVCGKLAFDPLEFSRQKAKEQLAMLRDLVGIDFTGLDDERASAFQTRTSVNREVKQLEGELAGLAFHEDAPEAETSVATIGEELQKATDHNAENQAARSKHDAIVDGLASLKTQLGDLLDELAELQAKIDSTNARIAKGETALAESKKAVQALADIDTAPIREKMRTVEGLNGKVRDNAKRAEVETKLTAARGRSHALTERLEAIDAEKSAELSAAKFPIDGLGFTDDGITFSGLPFEQASSAERIRVSAAMGLAMNPDLRVMLIRDGSLLGTEAMAMLGELAEERDAQIWVERVSDGAEVSVVIEDGSVKEDRTAKAEAITA